MNPMRDHQVRDSQSEYYDSPETVAAMVRGCKNFDDAVEVVKEYRRRDEVRIKLRQFLEEYDPERSSNIVPVQQPDLVRLKRALEK